LLILPLFWGFANVFLISTIQGIQVIPHVVIKVTTTQYKMHVTHSFQSHIVVML